MWISTIQSLHRTCHMDIRHHHMIIVYYHTAIVYHRIDVTYLSLQSMIFRETMAMLLLFNSYCFNCGF